MSNEAALVEEVVEEPSLREALESAVDEHAEAEVATPVVETPAVTEQPASTEPAASPAAAPTVPEQASVTPPTTELKAPAQWKPAVREKWNVLPREVQEEVLRREADSMRLIGSVGPKIRLADEVAGHIAPYADKIQEAGISPSAFIGDLFSSVKSLAQGSMQEKAEVVANIVQSYGVDLRLLDQVLTGRITAPPEVLEARRQMARAQALMQSHQSGVEHQSELEAEKAIAAFGADPKHEFLGEVRDLMADLIDSGRAKTLDDAYAAAIWAHEDTRKILLQREAQTRATAKGQRAAVARRASSSVSGSPAAVGSAASKSENLSLRESLEAAFDEHSSL
jgi:hypothetical protein